MIFWTNRYEWKLVVFRFIWKIMVSFFVLIWDSKYHFCWVEYFFVIFFFLLRVGLDTIVQFSYGSLFFQARSYSVHALKLDVNPYSVSWFRILEACYLYYMLSSFNITRYSEYLFWSYSCVLPRTYVVISWRVLFWWRIHCVFLE